MSSSATIFIADDNPAILQGLDRALSASGYRVRTATSGMELLKLLDSVPAAPDLILLDVMMPEISGIEVLRVIHGDDRWADLPVVLITASNDSALPASALRDGAVDFLAKPFRLDELLARVDAHVQRHHDLRRVRELARIRLQAIDLIRELNRVVTADEMFQLVTSRTAEILGVCLCSVLVVEKGENVARVIASSEGKTEGEIVVELANYPEIREALALGAAVTVGEVATSPLFHEERLRWASDGIAPPVQSVVAVPFPITETLSGVFVERSRLGEPTLGEGAEELAGRVVEAVVQACGRVQIFENLTDQRRRLDTLAHTDELTGCASRRSLLRHLREELGLAQRRGGPLSLVMLDIDHFKEVNDSHGHLAGDEVLRTLGAWLSSEGMLRAHDLAGRYGGDEFVVILPRTDVEGAFRFAERARKFFSGVRFNFEGAEVRVSLSAGVTSWADVTTGTAEELLASSDTALYLAKQEGRDKVRVAAPAMESAAAG